MSLLTQLVSLKDSCPDPVGNLIPIPSIFLQGSSLTFLPTLFPIPPPFLNLPGKDLPWVSGPVPGQRTAPIPEYCLISGKEVLELARAECPPESLVTSTKSISPHYLINASGIFSFFFFFCLKQFLNLVEQVHSSAVPVQLASLAFSHLSYWMKICCSLLPTLLTEKDQDTLDWIPSACNHSYQDSTIFYIPRVIFGKRIMNRIWG